MTAPLRPPLSVSRGVVAAAVGGWAAVILTAAVVAVRDNSLWSVPAKLLDTFFFWSAVGGGAGWATYAPAGRHSLPRTLLLVTFGSLVLVGLLAAVGVMPQMYRGTPPLSIQFQQAAVVTISPVVVAAALTTVRVRAATSARAGP